jgi:2-oxoglutarate ferredoxin oxidoreductase subunit beta
VVTGLLYISPDSKDMVEQNELVDTPLYNLPFEQLCPGDAELQKLQNRLR